MPDIINPQPEPEVADAAPDGFVWIAKRGFRDGEWMARTKGLASLKETMGAINHSMLSPLPEDTEVEQVPVTDGLTFQEIPPKPKPSRFQLPKGRG